MYRVYRSNDFIGRSKTLMDAFPNLQNAMEYCREVWEQDCTFDDDGTTINVYINERFDTEDECVSENVAGVIEYPIWKE